MATFESVFEGNPSQAKLESEINSKLNTLVISSMVSSSLNHANDDTNKAGLVFALGTGDKLQVKLFHEGGLSALQTKMQDWIDDNNYVLVQLAITYDNDQNRAMVIYKSLVTGSGYTVTAISKDKASNMQSAVNTEIEDSTVVISDSTFGGGKFRTVLITQPKS